MRILHLTLKRKWFCLIASGEKKHEYREMKPYWEKRLLQGPDGEGREFDEVHFRNGYRKDSPFMKVKCNGIAVTSRRWWTPMCGEEIGDNVIVILLGDILEVRE